MIVSRVHRNVKNSRSKISSGFLGFLSRVHRNVKFKPNCRLLWIFLMIDFVLGPPKRVQNSANTSDNGDTISSQMSNKGFPSGLPPGLRSTKEKYESVVSFQFRKYLPKILSIHWRKSSQIRAIRESFVP